MSDMFSVLALAPGEKLGPYKIESFLGFSSGVAIYKALDRQRLCDVIVKEYYPQGLVKRAEDRTVVPIGREYEDVFSRGLEIFRSRASALQSLKGLGVEAIEGIFDVGRGAFVVEPCSERVSLSEDIDKHLRLGIRKRAESVEGILKSLLRVLISLEQTHLVHGAISVESVFYDKNWRLVLGDFPLLETVSIEYPLACLPPDKERFEFTHMGDMYALGATIYKVITGGYPPKEEVDSCVNDASSRLLQNNEELVAIYGDRLLKSLDRSLSCRVQDRFVSAESWLFFLLAGKQSHSSETCVNHAHESSEKYVESLEVKHEEKSEKENYKDKDACSLPVADVDFSLIKGDKEVESDILRRTEFSDQGVEENGDKDGKEKNENHENFTEDKGPGSEKLERGESSLKTSLKSLWEKIVSFFIEEVED